MVLPQPLRRPRRRLKLALATSDNLSLAPEWKTIFVTDDGREARIPGIFSRRWVVVAPGKQWTIAPLKRTCFIMESPMIATDGGEGGDGICTAGDDMDGLLLD